MNHNNNHDNMVVTLHGFEKQRGGARSEEERRPSTLCRGGGADYSYGLPPQEREREEQLVDMACEEPPGGI
jgi:hypothetical protein